MRLVTLTAISLGLALAVPFGAAELLAHGGGYRGPPGEVPPGSRPPSDPPPPPSGDGPTTPGGEGGTPVTPGGGTSGPVTPGGPGGGGGGTPGGGPSAGGGPTGGPLTGPGGRGRGANSGPSSASWIYWWNFNKDPYIGLEAAVRRSQAGARSGSIAHAFGNKQAGGDRVLVVDAAFQSVAAPALRRLLATEDLNFDIRSAAAIALAKCGDETVVPTLGRMARGEGGRAHKVVEESAALAFGLLGKDGDDIRSTLLQIVDDKQRNASYVRPFAAVSLGLLGARPGGEDTATTEALLRVIAGKETKGDVKPACLLALGLGRHVSAVPELLSILDNGRASVPGSDPLSDVEMAYAVEALGRMGEPGLPGVDGGTEVVDALIDRALDRGRGQVPPAVRWSAAIALGRLGPACDGAVQTRIVRTLRDLLPRKGRRSLSDDSLRNFSMIALAEIAAAPQVQEATRRDVILSLAYQLDHGSTISRPFAGLGLGIVGRALAAGHGTVLEEDIRRPLREAFVTVRDPDARSAFAVASGLARDPLAVEALVATLGDRGNTPRLRGYSAVALGMIGDTAASDLVHQVLAQENDRELRVHLAVAAGLFGDFSVVRTLVGILESGEESQYVLGSAALALGQIGDERAVEALVRIAEDTQDRYPYLTRALATVALGQLGDRRDVPTLARVSTGHNYRAYVSAMAELLTIL